ncbi:MAG TPA: phosphoadenosine phosphosulfate reductase [Eubacterium sp.]|nr:phosphoadenosine phosphosulfate reductase [Eubacterium sp.]
MSLVKLLAAAPEDQVIIDSLTIADAKYKRYNNILCSISGGSDSDVMLDLCEKIDIKNKITYVFFDTGLEFEATKKHLKYLEKKYNIKIQIEKAVKPIPTCCKEYGQPFLSKQVSEWISRLQRHNFDWKNATGTFKQLLKKYPNCKAALRWWCNDYDKGKDGRPSSFNINYNQYLKEFMMQNPPKFQVSNKCCLYAKKKVAVNCKKNGNYDLSMYGVRKAEGGARKAAYKSCFSETESGCDEFRPIFWYLNENKKNYEDAYGIKHSDCYTKYGLKRTGCAGCPYSRNFEEELEVMEKYEPKLFKAVNNIFADSYAYTRKYRKFVEKMRKQKNKNK